MVAIERCKEMKWSWLCATKASLQSVSSVAVAESFWLCNLMDCCMPAFSVHHQLLELAQIQVHWFSDAMQPSPLLSPSPPAFNLSQHQGLFQSVSSLHRVAKVLELQLQLQYLSFQWIVRIGTLKSLLQHHTSKASVLWCSAFFMVQLSHPYMTTGETIALATWSFVVKVMSLLFNKLSMFVIAFLLRSKCLLIS